MTARTEARLILIRHAPALHGGRMAGRRDVDADLSGTAAIDALRDMLSSEGVDSIVTSPARRCVQTAQALWPGRAMAQDPRLWEQDFGGWEGLPFADLPDLGDLSRADLAAHRPPGGESFDDLCARVTPALREIAMPGVTAIIAHAGVIRAALGLGPSALGFEIAPLSVTILRAVSGDSWSIICVNRVAGG